MKTIILIYLLQNLLYSFNDFYKAENEPIQNKIRKQNTNYKNSILTHLFTYKIEARILSKKEYKWDKLGSIAILDIGVAWGKISESQNFNQFEWDQNNRFLIYSIERKRIKYLGGEEYINNHIANMHLIPKNYKIEKKLKTLKKYDIVELKGTLVDVSMNNKIWRTSIRRDDKKGGACEIMYVSEINIKHSRKKNNFYYQNISKKDRLSNKLRIDYKTAGKKTRAFNY